MSTSHSDVVQIVESEAHLRAHQGVGWWVQLASYTVGLEAENTRSHVINIIPPASNHRVSINFSARDASSGQRLLE